MAESTLKIPMNPADINPDVSVIVIPTNIFVELKLIARDFDLTVNELAEQWIAWAIRQHNAARRET